MPPEDPRILEAEMHNTWPEEDDDLYECDGCHDLYEDVCGIDTQDGLGQSLCRGCEEAHEMNWTDEQGPELVWLGTIKDRDGIRP